MKNNVRFYCYLLLSGITLSCKGKPKAEPVKESPAPPKLEITKSDEFDPYFVDTKNITSDYGPSSITRNILQDKKGNIWFATWEGIIRYDGKTFTNLTNKENLRRFHVFSLMEDSKGNIWFGTIGAGVYRYDGQSFTNFTTKDGLAHNSIGCFMEDKNGIIWIGTMNGISTFDGITFSNLTIDGGVNNNDINSIVEDDTGKPWIATRGKAFIYDGNSFTKVTTKKGQPFVNVRSILKDNEGTLWLGGNDGFWSYNGSTFTNYTTDFTGGIYQDSQENIWTGSEGGARKWVLTKYDIMTQRNKGATAIEIKKEENMFFGITEDNDGNIWLGTLRGAYRYDGITFKDFAPPKIPFE